jgi:hypothetical protein
MTATRLLQPRLDLRPALTFLAVAYVSLTTVDLTVGGVPMKLPVVAAALALWWRGRRASDAPWPVFTSAVVLFGVVVPVVWFGITLLHVNQDDPAQVHGTQYAVQQASRFVYVLLYLPLADHLRAGGYRADRLWTWPVYALCVITLGLLAAHLAGAEFGHDQRLGPLQGAISVDESGQFRAFLVNHVLLIPAAAFLLARLRAPGPARDVVAAGVLVGATAYVSHTRGIWFGICLAALALAAIPFLARPGAGRFRRIVMVLVGAGLLVAFVVNADPSVGGWLARSVVGTEELSGSLRYEQAPELHAAIERHPILGSGLGATPPSGYVRSEDSPWSFELSYLQLLFQLGIVGFVLVLAPALLAFVRCLRALPGLHGERRTRAEVAVAGLLGLLFASGSNPYLMTSVGTLALAILLAFADVATDPRSAAAAR